MKKTLILAMMLLALCSFAYGATDSGITVLGEPNEVELIEPPVSTDEIDVEPMEPVEPVEGGCSTLSYNVNSPATSYAVGLLLLMTVLVGRFSLNYRRK